MEIKQIQEILRTREKVTEMNGNTTELHFVRELILMADDYKRLKEQSDKR